jgi:hypothetical protein
MGNDNENKQHRGKLYIIFMNAFYSKTSLVHKKGGKVQKKNRGLGSAPGSSTNQKAFKFRSAIKARKLIRRLAYINLNFMRWLI